MDSNEEAGSICDVICGLPGSSSDAHPLPCRPSSGKPIKRGPMCHMSCDQWVEGEAAHTLATADSPPTLLQIPHKRSYLPLSPQIANRFLNLLVHVASSGHPDPFWVQVWGKSSPKGQPQNRRTRGAWLRGRNGGPMGEILRRQA